MADSRAVLDFLTTRANLVADERILLNQYVIAGHRLVSAGISTWHVLNGKLTRHTEQLRYPGIYLILDDTFLYKQLMGDMSDYTQNLLDEGHNKEDLDRLIYIYTADETEPRAQIKLHLFSRVSVMVDKPQ